MNTNQYTKQQSGRSTAGLLALTLGTGLLLALPQNAPAQSTARRTAVSAAKKPATKTVRIHGSRAKLVTMELRNAPVRDAIQQLFLQAKVDYMLDPNIVGTTTLKVTNVPFETALRLLIDASDVPIYVTQDSGVYDIRARAMRVRNRSDIRTASYVPPVPQPEPMGGPAGTPVVGYAPGVAEGLPAGVGYGAPGAPAVGVPFGGPAVNFNPYVGWGGWGGWGYPVFTFTTPVFGNTGAVFPSNGFNNGFGFTSGFGFNNGSNFSGTNGFGAFFPNNGFNNGNGVSPR
jgi:hypothetical protein